MAKVSFSKLGAKPNSEITEIKIGNSTVEVKRYLPMADKIQLIERVVNAAAPNLGERLVNWAYVNVMLDLLLVEYYSNISFTDKQKEDTYKFYDNLFGSGIGDMIIEAIPEDEEDWIVENVNNIINSIYEYKTSAMGIFEGISTDYKDLNLNADEIKNKLADRNGVEFLQEVLDKMG